MRRISASNANGQNRKYENGAVGCLNHIVALHGISYSNEIDIVADGYQLRLVDLYIEPKLFVRYATIRLSYEMMLTMRIVIRFPTDEREQEYHYPGDDPFSHEIGAVVHAADTFEQEQGLNGTSVAHSDVDTSSTDRILSSYEDAVKTYEFSWKIRTKSEETRLPHPSWVE